MTKEERIARSREASRIIESETFKAAFKHYTDEIRRLRLQVPPRDTEAAVKLVQMEQTVEKAKRIFEAFIQDGDLAANELEREVNPGIMQRFRRVV